MKTTLGSWRRLGALAAFALFASTLVRGQVSKDELFQNPFAIHMISGLGERAALSVAKVDGILYAYLMTFPGRGSRLLAQLRIGEVGNGRLGFSVVTSPLGATVAIIENEKTIMLRTRLMSLRVVKEDNRFSIRQSSTVLAGWRLTQGACNLNENYVYAMDSRDSRILGWSTNNKPTAESVRELPWDAYSREMFIERRKLSTLIKCPQSLQRGFLLSSGCIGGPSTSYSLREGQLTLNPSPNPPQLQAYVLCPRGAAVDQSGAQWSAESSWLIQANQKATLISPTGEAIVLHPGLGPASSEVDLGGKIDASLVAMKDYKLVIGRTQPRRLGLRLSYGRAFSEIARVRHASIHLRAYRPIDPRKKFTMLRASVSRPRTGSLCGFLLLAWRTKEGMDRLLRSKTGKVFLDPQMVRPVAIKTRKSGRASFRHLIESQPAHDRSRSSGTLLSQFILVDSKSGKVCASHVYTNTIRQAGEFDAR